MKIFMLLCWLLLKVITVRGKIFLDGEIKYAEDQDFFYTVSFRAGDRPYCSGVLLNNYWILTTRTCCTSLNLLGVNAVNIHINTSDINDDGKVFAINECYVYTENATTYDIALVEVEGRINATKFIHLTSQNPNFLPQTTHILIAGWGKTRNSPDEDIRELYTSLRYVSGKLSSTYQCTFRKDHDILTERICVSFENPDLACIGDEGSGVILYSQDSKKNNIFNLIGLVGLEYEVCTSSPNDPRPVYKSYIDIRPYNDLLLDVIQLNKTDDSIKEIHPQNPPQTQNRK